MKVFHCDHCEAVVVFENSQCVACKHPLAYLPDLGVVGSLDLGENGLWHSPLARAACKTYRLCQNYTDHNTCNWAVQSEDSNPYCLSCRLSSVIPDLSKPANKEAWFKVEVAKRRLVYSLLSLKLPVCSKSEDPKQGLTFRLLEDPADPQAPRVLTGHSDGVVTINIAEANDSERERRRSQMHEGYRTLLGHFRHEIGHYYWVRLIQNSPHLAACRELFGDERKDYAKALERHYREGPRADWQERYISAYASAHPSEDWAESWAHYLHMTDTLETCADCGLRLLPKRQGEPSMTKAPAPASPAAPAFETMIQSWYSVTFVLNNLNRGMGLLDSYPFVLSTPVVEKLRLVHQVVTAKASRAEGDRVSHARS